MPVLADLRYGVRGLRRSPGFAIAIALTLGLGVGANAAMLGAIDRLMFRSFPYLRDPATIHRVYFQTTSRHGITSTRSAGPYTTYVDLAGSTRSFSQFAGFSEWSLALGPGDAAIEHTVDGVSASFFDFFDARPRLGRFFTTSEDSPPHGANVAVLGYGYWQSAFGGRDVIGQRLEIGPLLTTIIGIAPKDFVGVSEGEAPAVFIPITTLAFGVNQGDAASFARKYTWYWMNVMARRKPGVTIAEATADLTNAFDRSWEKARAELRGTPPASVVHARAIAGALRTRAGPDAGLESKTLLWVTGVASIVLLIACANLANLLLARLLGRQREIAVRLALGASRLRLLGQFAAEALLLAVLGCFAGLVVAQSVTFALARLGIDTSGTGNAVDWRTLFIAATLALVAGLVTYLGPVVVLLRGSWESSLRSGTRSTYRHGRLQAVLLALQATLSVLLLVGAGLFVRSLERARAVRLGWNPTSVLVVTPNYRGFTMDSTAQDAFRRRLLATAQAIPGVVAAARVDNLPFRTSTRDFFVDGIDSVERLGRFVSQVVSPDYFAVMHTRILRGRHLDVHDRAGEEPVVVVSESMGGVLWPGEDPIGRCLRFDAADGVCTRVVGVAEDAASTGLGDEDRFMYYVSDDQPPKHPANRIFIRVAASDPDAYREPIRRALQRVMPGEAYVSVAPLETLVDTERRSWMLGATMFVAFGGLALIVAAVGLYGVISYQVAQTRRELGVRIALGAQAKNIIRLVIGRGLGLAALGAGLGLLLACVAASWVQPLLFRESATDPWIFALVAAALIVVALGASWLPAARALRTDPTSVLRDAE